MDTNYVIVIDDTIGLRPGLYQVAQDGRYRTRLPESVSVVDDGHEALIEVPLQDPRVVPVTDELIDVLHTLVPVGTPRALWPEWVIAAVTVRSAIFDSTIPRSVYRSAHKTHPFERESGLLYVNGPQGMFCLSTWNPDVVVIDDVLIEALRQYLDRQPGSSAAANG